MVSASSTNAPRNDPFFPMVVCLGQLAGVISTNA